MNNLLKLLRVVAGTSLIGAIVFAETAFSAQPVFEGAEVVAFESVSYTYPASPFKVKQAKKLGKPVETVTEPSVPLIGYLARPQGEGPFPAVALMNGCASVADGDRAITLLSEWNEAWSDRLVAWGYVVLSVDSFTPRGASYICDGRRGWTTPWSRALDAYGARRYLSTRPFVDPDRIAVMGMAHGGTTILEIIKQSTSTGLGMKPFGAAVALYPLCGEPEPIDTPTLVLIGGADAWTPADQCVRYLDRLERPHEMTLKVFPGVHHVFDQPGIDYEEFGRIVRSDPDAATQAIRMTHEFLSERM
jgi:dienelactone hydrolase